MKVPTPEEILDFTAHKLRLVKAALFYFAATIGFGLATLAYLAWSYFKLNGNLARLAQQPHFTALATLGAILTVLPLICAIITFSAARRLHLDPKLQARALASLRELADRQTPPSA